MAIRDPLTVEQTMALRKDNARAILDINRAINNLEKLHIDAEELADLPIQQMPLSLDERSKDRPNFFTTYQAGFAAEQTEDWEESFPVPKPDMHDHANIRALLGYIETCIPPRDGLNSTPGTYSTSWGQFNFGALFESGNYFWSVYDIGVALANLPSHKGPNERLPHVKAMLETNAVGDERLLRSEIKTICKIMQGRLRVKSLRPHVVAPVMVFSFMGPHHLRVLEASFDGENLLVRQTPLYKMKKYDRNLVELLCRWWLGFAVGETRSMQQFKP